MPRGEIKTAPPACGAPISDRRSSRTQRGRSCRPAVAAPPRSSRRRGRSRSPAARPRPRTSASASPPARAGRTCGRYRARPKKYSPKSTLNRRTLYRELQKMPIPSPRLASPIKLGLALSGAPGRTTTRSRTCSSASRRGKTSCTRPGLGLAGARGAGSPASPASSWRGWPSRSRAAWGRRRASHVPSGSGFCDLLSLDRGY